MIVGFLGGTPFLVSRDYVYTFKDFNRSSSARYAKHEIIGAKPLMEFLGPDAEEIGFKIHLRSDLGVNPRVELDKLRKYRDKGRVMTLIIGGRVIGKTLWVVESIGETVQFWSRTGQVMSVEVDIKLKEYAGGFDQWRL